MRPSLALNSHRQEIRDIVHAHRAQNPRVFGSCARGEDTSDSDLDLLVDPTPETTLLDIDDTARYRGDQARIDSTPGSSG
ncbi:MAG: nucleotidyltransferase family protein [Actinomycetales bacterium]